MLGRRKPKARADGRRSPLTPPPGNGRATASVCDIKFSGINRDSRRPVSMGPGPKVEDFVASLADSLHDARARDLCACGQHRPLGVHGPESYARVWVLKSLRARGGQPGRGGFLAPTDPPARQSTDPLLHRPCALWVQRGHRGPAWEGHPSQAIAAYCSLLRLIAGFYILLQPIAGYCNLVQTVAAYCC